MRLIHADLIAGDAPPLHTAAQHPVDAAVPVVSAAIAVLAEGSAEFADHHDGRVGPIRPHTFSKSRKTFAERGEPAGEIAARIALVHMRVPAADIDEAETVF